MEKAVRTRKIRNSIYLIILAVILLSGIALGIYWMIAKDRDKTPNRGTYVLDMRGKEYDL